MASAPLTVRFVDHRDNGSWNAAHVSRQSVSGFWWETGWALKVVARPVHWQNTKRTLEEGTNGLGTRDVYDYRGPVSCLEDVPIGAGTGWVGLLLRLLCLDGIALYWVDLRGPSPLMDSIGTQTFDCAMQQT